MAQFIYSLFAIITKTKYRFSFFSVLAHDLYLIKKYINCLKKKYFFACFSVLWNIVLTVGTLGTAEYSNLNLLPYHLDTLIADYTQLFVMKEVT